MLAARKLQEFQKKQSRKLPPVSIPQKPPRPPRAKWTPYLFFVHSNRARICEENPNVGKKEIAKLVSTAWTLLSEMDRRKYTLQAKEDAARYLYEQEIFAKELSEYCDKYDHIRDNRVDVTNQIEHSSDLSTPLERLGGKSPRIRLESLKLSPLETLKPKGVITTLPFNESSIDIEKHRKHQKIVKPHLKAVSSPRVHSRIKKQKRQKVRKPLKKQKSSTISQNQTVALVHQTIYAKQDQKEKHNVKKGQEINSQKIHKFDCSTNQTRDDNKITFSTNHESDEECKSYASDASSDDSYMSAGGLACDGPVPYKKIKIRKSNAPLLSVELITKNKSFLDCATGQLMVKMSNSMQFVEPRKNIVKPKIDPLEIGGGILTRSCLVTDDYHYGSIKGMPPKEFREILRNRYREESDSLQLLDFSYFEEKKNREMMFMEDATKERNRRRMWVRGVPVNKVFFERGCFSIAGTTHIVSVFGVGMDGRVYTAGSDGPKFIQIEAYDATDCGLYKLEVNMRMLPSLLGKESQHLLRPGHKREVISRMMKLVYFIFPNERFDPIGALDLFALRFRNPSLDDDWISYDERLRVYGVESTTGLPPSATVASGGSPSLISQAGASRYTGAFSGKSEAMPNKTLNKRAGRWSDGEWVHGSKTMENIHKSKPYKNISRMIRPESRQLDTSGFSRISRPKTEHMKTSSSPAVDISSINLSANEERLQDFKERFNAKRATTAPFVRAMQTNVRSKKEIYNDVSHCKTRESSRWKNRPLTRYSGMTLLEAIVAKKQSEASLERSKLRAKLRRKRERRIRRIKRKQYRVEKESKIAIKKLKERGNYAKEFQDRIKLKRQAEKDGKPWPPKGQKTIEEKFRLLQEKKNRRHEKRKKEKLRGIQAWRRLKSGFSSKETANENNHNEESSIRDNDYEYVNSKDVPVGIGWELAPLQPKFENDSDSSSSENSSCLSDSDISSSSSSMGSLSFDSQTTECSGSEDSDGERPLPTNMAIQLHHMVNFFNGGGVYPLKGKKEEEDIFKELEFRLELKAPKECGRLDLVVQETGKQLRIQQIFEALDQDKDGIINWTEWNALIPRKRLGISPGIKALGVEETMANARLKAKKLKKEIDDYNREVLSNTTFDLTDEWLKKQHEMQQDLSVKDKVSEPVTIESTLMKTEIDNIDEAKEKTKDINVLEKSSDSDYIIQSSSTNVEQKESKEVQGTCKCRPMCMAPSGLKLSKVSTPKQDNNGILNDAPRWKTVLPWEMSKVDRLYQRSNAKRNRELIYRITRKMTHWHDIYIIYVFKYIRYGKCFYVRVYNTKNSEQYNCAISFRFAEETFHLPKDDDSKYSDTQWLLSVARMLAKKVTLEQNFSVSLGSFMRICIGTKRGLPGAPLRSGDSAILSYVDSPPPRYNKSTWKPCKRLRNILLADRFEKLSGSPLRNNKVAHGIGKIFTYHKMRVIYDVFSMPAQNNRYSIDEASNTANTKIADFEKSLILIRLYMPRSCKVFEFTVDLNEIRVHLLDDTRLAFNHPLSFLFPTENKKDRKLFEDFMDRLLGRELSLCTLGNENFERGDGLIQMPKRILKFVYRVPIVKNSKDLTDQDLADMYTAMEENISSSEEETIDVDGFFDMDEIMGGDNEAANILKNAPIAERPDSALREEERRKKIDEEKRIKKEKKRAEFEERRKKKLQERRIQMGRCQDDEDSDDDEEEATSQLLCVTVDIRGTEIIIKGYDPRPNKRLFYDTILPEMYREELFREINTCKATPTSRDKIIIDYIQDTLVLEQQGKADEYLWKVKEKGEGILD